MHNHFNPGYFSMTIFLTKHNNQITGRKKQMKNTIPPFRAHQIA